MTDRYVNPAVGSSGTGDSWAQAYKTLKEATDAAAAGEKIYFATGTSDPPTSDTTYTLADGVVVISTSDTTNNPPLTYASGAAVDASGTAGVDLIIACAGGAVSIYGVKFKVGNSSSASEIRIGSANASSIYLDDCDFEFAGTSGSSQVEIGVATVNRTSDIVTRNCTYTWSNAGQGISISCNYKSWGDDFSAGSTHPTVLFETVEAAAAYIEIFGGDLSDISTVFEAGPLAPLHAVVSGCKMKSSFTIFAMGVGEGEAWMHDCSSGDEHYHLGHWNAYGSTLISTSVRCTNAGATYDGTNYHSWVVSSTADAGPERPYYSPWVDVYHSGTSAITPHLEALRSGSATAYTDAEVWAEFAYKADSGSTRYTLVPDRNANYPLVAGTAQTASSLGASDWVGESGTDAYFKLGPASSITPAEIGHIRARVAVAKASVTDLYVDPKIRGLT